MDQPRSSSHSSSSETPRIDFKSRFKASLPVRFRFCRGLVFQQCMRAQSPRGRRRLVQVDRRPRDRHIRILIRQFYALFFAGRAVQTELLIASGLKFPDGESRGGKFTHAETTNLKLTPPIASKASNVDWRCSISSCMGAAESLSPTALTKIRLSG